MPPKYIPEWQQLRNLTSWFLFLTDLVFKWATSQHIWWKGFGARFFFSRCLKYYLIFFTVDGTCIMKEIEILAIRFAWIYFLIGIFKEHTTIFLLNINYWIQIRNYDLIYDKSRNNFNYLLFYFSLLI